MGAPVDRFPVLHVAGTNGKGSTSAMLAAMGRAAGLRTGLYTSPHLLRFAERIQIDGTPIDDEVLAEHLTVVLDRFPELTFFEVATLAAFTIFAEAGVELAVLEVGLGGRLDATNVVVRPLVTAVTSIGLDHQEWLGDTVALIAAEKAAIAKPGVPMVLGPLDDEARAVVVATAEARGATIVHARPGVLDGDAVLFAHAGHSVRARLGLHGRHQRENAAVACHVAWTSGLLDDEAIALGLANARWPGRLEALDTPEGRVLLDGAHNPDGVRVLVEHLDEHPGPARALVFGAMGDKDFTAMVPPLARRCRARVYVTPTLTGSTRSATPPDTLLALDPGGVAAGDLAEALARAREAVGPGGEVIVAGSLYLVAEARALLLGLPRDPQVGL
ncbi:MAG: bifunctional folylpolyglutamate synthase/dihydrofolate synthase [Myxococcales bacterium]|nr:bifunctional folylpolyglutamate synthase/dihydrofolate synthase [Myxococcales bacterium]